MSAESLWSVADFLESLLTIGTFGGADSAVEVAAVLVPPNTAAFIATELLWFHFQFLDYYLPTILTMVLIRLRRECLPRLDVMPPTIGFYGTFADSDFCGDFGEVRTLFPHFCYGLLLNIIHVHYHLIIYEYAWTGQNKSCPGNFEKYISEDLLFTEIFDIIDICMEE